MSISTLDPILQVVIAYDACDKFGAPICVDQYNFSPATVMASISVPDYIVFQGRSWLSFTLMTNVHSIALSLTFNYPPTHYHTSLLPGVQDDDSGADVGTP